LRGAVLATSIVMALKKAHAKIFSEDGKSGRLLQIASRRDGRGSDGHTHRPVEGGDDKCTSLARISLKEKRGGGGVTRIKHKMKE